MPNDPNALPPETAPQEITPVLRIYTEQTSDTGGIWGLKPWAFRHVCWVPEQDYHDRVDHADTMRAQLDATLKDRAMIIAERDRTFALTLERAERAEAALIQMRRVAGALLGLNEDAQQISLQKPQTTPAPVWHFLDEWQPPEGTWAILWPGYYGPFTACRIGVEWSMCDDQDLNNATIATPCPEPRHDMTDHFVIKERGEE